MPYLTNIGPHELTKSGLASRGYHIYRRGKIVFQGHGQVDHTTRRNMKVYWNYRKIKKEKCRSEEDAKEYLREKLEELESKGYRRLGTGVKIRQKPKRG